DCVVRTLRPTVVGRRVTGAELRRGDIVHGLSTAAALLAGDRVTAIERLGKQMALVGQRGSAVCVHLGMTGSLVRCAREAWLDSASDLKRDHAHVIWHLDDVGVLVFRDPRRFGGVWTFPSVDAL